MFGVERKYLAVNNRKLYSPKSDIAPTSELLSPAWLTTVPSTALKVLRIICLKSATNSWTKDLSWVLFGC